MTRVAKGLVLDANVIVDAVLGTRVGGILDLFNEVRFCAPDVCLNDARRRVREITSKRRIDEKVAFYFLDKIEALLDVIEEKTYSPWEEKARARIQYRDRDDWPVIATALALDLPIWTEDRDFFGCGVALWITRTVEIYLHGADDK